MQFVRNGPDVPERLLQAHEDCRVVFFCGSGISFPAGLPGFSGLVKQLSDHFGYLSPEQANAIEAKQYDRAVGLLERDVAGGRQIVRRKIADILKPDLNRPRATDTHRALLELARHNQQQARLITTNFDRLFEHVIVEDDLTIGSFEAPLLPIPKQRWDGLVYLHGLLPEDPDDRGLDNLVVSSGNFGLAYLLERWAARFVTELFQNFTVCFVGYSIDDPILRYMTDALAADQQRGEAPTEMFAFGCYSKGKEVSCSNEWRAKNVTPILYKSYWRHAYLHRTLRKWADDHRDGVLGKERIVFDYAGRHPSMSTNEDDFVSRMLWALSDPSGLPAKRFATFDPAPTLDWLDSLNDNRFGHDHLIRLSPWMALAGNGLNCGLDQVTRHLVDWLTRHLNNPKLFFWLAKQGGRPHPDFQRKLSNRLIHLAKLEDSKHTEELNKIRENAPDAIPDAPMRVLWDLLFSGLVKSHGQDLSSDDWLIRFNNEGLTTALRLELRALLSPRVSYSEPFNWPAQLDDGGEEDTHSRTLSDIISCEIVLSKYSIHDTLYELRDNRHWTTAQPVLLSDFTGLLRDVLDLKREMGGADDWSDESYFDRPSISEHSQNRDRHDWTVLIDLTRDAWLKTATRSCECARHAAENWSRIPYPLFRRLAFFAAANGNIIASDQALEWLLADEGWWLWSNETHWEAMRLLATLAPRLNSEGLAKLEQAILSGPPRNMFVTDLQAERWTYIQERGIWRRLAKIDDADVQLAPSARDQMSRLSEKYPDWQLADDEREEFPTWRPSGLRVPERLPREPDKLINSLRENPGSGFREDDWSKICRDEFELASSALIALANQGIWPEGRWRKALSQWTEDELTQDSWSRMAPVIAKMPESTLYQIRYGLSWWLEELAKTVEGQEETFYRLCDRLLKLAYEVADDSNDHVNKAINHPVGHVTEALLNKWYRSEPQANQGLVEPIRDRFTCLCSTSAQKYRHGRVMLGANMWWLFLVDPLWTVKFMLPHFDWGSKETEAGPMWEGFLWTSNFYEPLMEHLKPAFLETANHFDQLGGHKQRFASLLTFGALEPRDFCTNTEMKHALSSLPTEGLEQVSASLVKLINSVGDKRSNYWENRVAPFLRDIWPKSADRLTEQVSANLARACIAAGDAFPDALKEIEPWLKPLNHPHRIACELHSSKLIAQFPELTLDLLRRIYRDQAQLFPNELAKCLTRIKSAKSELSEDHRFEYLDKILSKSG